MDDLRDQLRKELLDSYKHRIVSDCSCAICGKTNSPLAFHVLEESFNEDDALPISFVKMSSSRGRVRGSYPVCNSCAPGCKKCQLPITTEKVMEYSNKFNIRYGNGMCQHMQIGILFSSILKRIFKFGRFSKIG